jgi:hypothetical protein
VSLLLYQSLLYPSVDVDCAVPVLVPVLYHHDPNDVDVNVNVDMDMDGDDADEKQNGSHQQNLAPGACDLSKGAAAAAESKVRILASLDCVQAEVACGHHKTLESEPHWISSGVVVVERTSRPLVPLPHRLLLLPRHPLPSPANGIAWMMMAKMMMLMLIMQPPCLKK